MDDIFTHRLMQGCYQKEVAVIKQAFRAVIQEKEKAIAMQDREIESLRRDKSEDRMLIQQLISRSGIVNHIDSSSRFEALTGNQLMDRSINVPGTLQGVASTGDNASISQRFLTDSANVVTEFQEIIERLSSRYSNASNFQKQTVLQMELQQKLVNDPTFRDRFIGALKAGGVELVKVITNNPFVSVPIETVKGWIEAEPV